MAYIHSIFGASEQVIIFIILIIAMVLFVRGKWRYDLVSLTAFLAVVLLGALAPEEAFAGFSHPAVIVVAAAFILSKGLVNSGIIEIITRRLTLIDRHPVVQLFVLLFLTTFFSAFINNVGALAFVMPIAIQMARRSNVSSAMFLMPLAFASHLGGYLTLIGTPRNILISTFRQEVVGEPFLMFDFIYVGAGIAAVGILYLGFLGWRLIPNKGAMDKGEVFAINDYVVEVLVTEESKAVGKQLKELCDPEKSDYIVTALIRDNDQVNNPAGYVLLRPGDVLLIQADAASLEDLIEKNKLQFGGKKAQEIGVSTDPEAEENVPIEAVVMPASNIVGKTWQEIKWGWRYGVNLLAVSRGGTKIKQRLSEIKFKPSDVLMLYGRRESVEDTIMQTGCIPLAERSVPLGRKVNALPILFVFSSAVILATFGILPLEIIFISTALIMILFNMVPIKEAYNSIDWPILILLGSMISIGIAFESSGGAETISNFLLGISDFVIPVIMLVIVLFISMVLSDFVNATASAVLMAPIAIIIAQTIDASVDPFLMAIVIGVSSSFITPTGHESNTLVMGPGGYQFKDYIKVGLPLEILVLVVSVPLLLHFWPMY